MTYDSSLAVRPRWRPLHNRQSLRRLRDPRATVARVALSVVAVFLVAALVYVLTGGTLPLLERAASPAATAAPFTRPVPAAASLLTSTATATAAAPAIFVATLFPTQTLPLPTATRLLVVPTRPLPTTTAIPPTRTLPPPTNTAVPPTATEAAPSVPPTITALAVPIQAAATSSPSPPQATVTPQPTAAILTPSATEAPLREHVVQAGESASEIAERYNITTDALVEANGGQLENRSVLQIGMKLAIPPSPDPTATPEGVIVHTVETGEAIWSIAERFQVTREALLEANRDRIDDPTLIQPGMQLLIPILGEGPPTQ